MNRSVAFAASLFVCFLSPSLNAATKTWTGPASGFWSIGTNWNTGTPPVDGDSLLFPAGISNTVNDIVGLDLVSIEMFSGSVNAGEGITLSGGMTTHGHHSWVVPITLTASQTFDHAEFDFDSTLHLNGHALTYISHSPASTLAGTIVGSGSFTLASGELSLLAFSSFSGTTTVSPGTTLQVPGAIVGSTLDAQSGAILVASATLAATTLTAATLILHDNFTADSLVILHTGNLALNGGTVQMQIQGTTPDTQHDQIAVAGTVSLGNPVLAITMPSGFPVPGDTYVLIANDGADAISGTFSGLPEGSILSIGAASFQITYAGGDGNDVALIAQSGPKAWIGPFTGFWSIGSNWTTGTPPVDGDSLLFPTGTAHALNDITGLDLVSIEMFSGSVSAGEGITLSGGMTTHGHHSWLVPITLTASQTFDHAEFDFDSTLHLNGHALTYISHNPASTLAGSIVGSGSFTLASGELHLTGTSSFGGAFTVSSGATLGVQGAIIGGPLNVQSGATLLGSGTVVDATLTGAALRVGAFSIFGTETFDTGNLAINGGSVNIQITGPAPGTQHDQIVVAGTLTLTNPTLAVTVPLGSLTPGTTFVIISNDGTDAINGTFNGLPEGAAFPAAGYTFRITYAGGSGNDVVLTVVAATTTTLAVTAAPGNVFTFTAHVTSTSGTPAGTVQFVEGATVLGSAPLDGSGNASITIALPPGAHFVVARYLGQGLFAPSASAAAGVDAVDDVPSLGTLALLALAILLAAAGAFAVRTA